MPHRPRDHTCMCSLRLKPNNIRPCHHHVILTLLQSCYVLNQCCNLVKIEVFLTTHWKRKCHRYTQMEQYLISHPVTFGAGDKTTGVGQYRGWWCQISLRRQTISCHAIDYVRKLEPYSGRRSIISTTWAISMCWNYIKYVMHVS